MFSCHFLDLQFADIVHPTKIEILETYNPGAVVRILALELGSCNKHRLVLWFANLYIYLIEKKNVVGWKV